MHGHSATRPHRIRTRRIMATNKSCRYWRLRSRLTRKTTPSVVVAAVRTRTPGIEEVRGKAMSNSARNRPDYTEINLVITKLCSRKKYYNFQEATSSLRGDKNRAPCSAKACMVTEIAKSVDIVKWLENRDAEQRE